MAIYYKAPQPTYSKWEWFKFYAVRTLFPPVLLWDLLKLGANRLLGGFVGSIILPAQRRNAHGISDSELSNYTTGEYFSRKYDVETYDGAHLDTFEIVHRSQYIKAPPFQRYIINFVGNGMCYKDIIDDMQQDARELGVNVVGFDLRGVGSSKGKPKSKDDLVVDGIAQVQRLLDAKVSPENIVLKAHSLGAGIASLVACHFKQQGILINVFNSRSFSSVTDLLVGRIRLDLNEKSIGGRQLARGNFEPFSNKVKAWILKPFIILAVLLVNWEINAGDAFQDLPGDYRDYIVVRSRKTIREQRLDDQVIPHYGSIHEALTSERKDKLEAIDQVIKQAQESGADTAELSSLKDQRERIKSGNKMETPGSNRNEEGHNIWWTGLKNRSGTDARTFFKEFVQRAAEHHGVHEPIQLVKPLVG